jgi:arylsulfatase A-like enzyme
MVDYIAADTAIQFLQDVASGSTSTCDRPFMLAIGFKRPHVDRYIPEHYYPEWFLENLDSLPFPYPYNQPFNQFPPNGFMMPPQPFESDYADYNLLPDGGMGQFLADNGDFFEDREAYIASLTEYPVFEDSISDSARLDILERSINAAYMINYFAAVQFIDAQVGRVIDELNAHPSIAENTIILLVSDHGYSLGEKKHFGKWVLWETVNRIPMILHGPGIPMDSVVSPVSLLDVFPTILDLAGGSAPLFPDGSTYLDGKSLLPFIENPHKNINHPSLQIYKRGSGKGSCFPQISVRNHQYHLINYRENNDGSFGTGVCDEDAIIYEKELYDIGLNREIDPEEWNNLASDSDYAPLIEYMSLMFPDSALYKKPHYSIQFLSKSSPCLVDDDATIRLIPKIFADNGGIIAGSLLDSITFTWTNSLSSDTIHSRILNYPLSGLPEASFSSSDDLFFYLHLTNSLTNELIGFNQYQVMLHTDSEPEINFSVVLHDHTAYVYDAEINGTFSAYSWRIDDQFTTNAPLPAPYEVTDSELHHITLQVRYGNNCYKELVRSFADLPGIILEQTPNNTQLYPNPSGSSVWLKTSLPVNQIVLIDMQGRYLPLSWTGMSEGVFLLESAGIPAGNYLITATGPEGQVSCLWQVKQEAPSAGFTMD